MSPEPRYCWTCAEDLEPNQKACPMCDEPTMTRADAEERSHFQNYDGESEPPVTMAEQHAAAWQQREELRRGR